jgi:hypothetical protein
MDKNQQVLATAFKKTKSKLGKIKEMGITPDFTEDQVTALTQRLAEAKAIEDGVDMREHLDNQEWYVRHLVDFAKLGVVTEEDTHPRAGVERQLNAEYEDSFASVAEEDDMLEALEALTA